MPSMICQARHAPANSFFTPYNLISGKIWVMAVNYTKKWWLLGCHRRAERLYSTRGSNDGTRVLISQNLFINGHKEHAGLIHKYNPFVRFRFSYLIFWRNEYSEEQLKVKRQAYHTIYEVCVQEGYITKEKVQQPNGEVLEFPTVANPKAYNIAGFPGYLQGLFTTYDKVSLAIGAFIVALMGSSVLASILTKDDGLAPVINIATPEVRPEVNVYPVINLKGDTQKTSTSTP